MFLDRISKHHLKKLQVHLIKYLKPAQECEGHLNLFVFSDPLFPFSFSSTKGYLPHYLLRWLSRCQELAAILFKHLYHSILSQLIISTTCSQRNTLFLSVKRFPVPTALLALTMMLILMKLWWLPAFKGVILDQISILCWCNFNLRRMFRKILEK